MRPVLPAKNPINIAEFVMDNVINSRVKQFFWDEADAIARDLSATAVDVRTLSEYGRRHIEGCEHPRGRDHGQDGRDPPGTSSSV